MSGTDHGLLCSYNALMSCSEKQFTSLVLDAHIQQACMEHLPRHVEHAIQECSAVDATIKSFGIVLRVTGRHPDCADC